MPANITDKCSSNTINSVYEPLLWKDCLTKALCFLANSKVRGLKSCCHMVVYIYISNKEFGDCSAEGTSCPAEGVPERNRREEEGWNSGG